MARIKDLLPKVFTVFVVVGLAAGGWFGVKSEAFQRGLGKREATKIVTDQIRPSYGSIVVEERRTYIVPDQPSTVQLTSSVNVDPASQRAKETITIASLGVDAAQSVTGTATSPETVGSRIWTLDATYMSGDTDADPWTREPTWGPYTMGTYLDEYLVPVMNDVLGMELAQLEYRAPNKARDTNAGATAPVPFIAPTELPAEVTDQRRWSLTIGAFRTLSPVAFAKTPFADLPTATDADVTMGFDDAGVLRYLMVTVDPTKVPPSVDGLRVFSFEWEVVDVAKDPVTIDLPAAVVDAPVA